MWVKTRQMPVHKVGQLLKFQVGEIDKWVRDGKAAKKKRSKIVEIGMVSLADSKHYTANLTVAALLVPESRKIAELMLSEVDDRKWKDVVEVQNILQKRSVATAKRIAAFIRARLKLMKPTLWKLIAEGDSEVATHAVLAATVKHSPLLGDYLDTVVREQFRNFEERLSLRLWNDYIQQCMQRDPSMPEFPESTAQKVRANVHKVLYEVGYLCNRHSMLLQHVEISPEVISYLEENREDYVLRCIQV